MDRKFGDGHVNAMLRLGLKELRNALNPSRESVADAEIGLYGTLTQGEIAQARGGNGKGPEQEAPDRKLSLDELREYGKEQEKEDRSRETGKDLDRGDEREL